MGLTQVQWVYPLSVDLTWLLYLHNSSSLFFYEKRSRNPEVVVPSYASSKNTDFLLMYAIWEIVDGYLFEAITIEGLLTK